MNSTRKLIAARRAPLYPTMPWTPWTGWPARTSWLERAGHRLASMLRGWLRHIS